ncbi:PX domain-containing protein [Ceratocystis fimbriata CBS 114723]|uniref:PX domain-containing protein n=1 Tax=Ceratocystis fimbriata CBS 114723 TaxID=1035309 RepID=A0A2C5WXI5_9PEZI|nr:PX domain-containing protein [Ceratocystis fimbriata CBS 114723]
MTTSPTATHLEASSPSFNPDAVPPPENSTISIADSTIPRSTLPRGESGDILSETASLSLDAAVSSNSLPTPPTISSRASALAINNSQLTGKQEHYLKRELISEQVKTEIHELNSPTALRRFGAPFKSHLGEISPLDSELPILRYIFVHHVRDFPFLDKAREKEFWQDKLQVFLESFASKSISSSEDRLEETKRRKLATKCQKLVELMMVSGVRTSSGFEERIRFSELEIVDSNAIETGVMHTIPEGNYINGWDVNVAGVRIKSERRNIRQHKHAEFILRVKRKGELEYFITRRYGDFSCLHHNLRLELPGKILPNLPKKNKTDSVATGLFSFGDGQDESSSISSGSTDISNINTAASNVNKGDLQSSQNSTLKVSSPNLTLNNRRGFLTETSAGSRGHRRAGSNVSRLSKGSSPRSSYDFLRSPLASPLSSLSSKRDEPFVVLGRESQRISMRAFLRSLLHSAPVAQTKAMQEFLTRDPVSLTDDDVEDITCRKIMDERRVEEQHQFYEIARKRAADLDEYMEQFRQDIIERNGLTKLFQEIKEKNTIEDLSIQYRKFAEWLRIEVAATIYHVFLAEDNSPEIFAQAKRIHSLIPYTVLKNVIRIANPAAVMSGVLDIFLAQPFGTRSLMQRIFSLTLHDGIKSFQKSIDTLAQKIDDDVLVNKIKAYTEASDEAKDRIRHDSESEDLIVAILRSDELPGQLSGPQMVRLFNAYKAFNSAVENDCDDSQKSNAQLFSYMKQLLKLCTRQRDKSMMLRLIEEPVTLQLFRDLFTIFYEPLVRVYKAANVYNSVTDFAHFIDDMIQVVEKCQEQDVSADPNQTVQAFIDLCQRHESNFYKFVHEVHVHDNGLFTQLMGWIEGILDFLRKGPTNGTLNVNELFEGSTIDKEKAIREINELISWQEARKKWHQDKTRQKMAAESTPDAGFNALSTTFSASDFGLDMGDIAEVNYEEESESEVEMEEEDELDPIEAERKRRAKRQDRLRRTAGEPVKPVVSEVHKLKGGFLTMLRGVLAQ